MMHIVNRGFIKVQPVQAFYKWANQYDEDYNDLIDNEASVYLIEDDFFDDEQILKTYFKKIMTNEFSAIIADKSVWPELKQEVFEEMFEIELGTTVFDAHKSDLTRD